MLTFHWWNPVRPLLLIKILRGDIYPDIGGIYLKPVKVSEESIYYKVDKVIYRDDKTLRFTIGEAYQNKYTNGDIHILIEPLTNFYKKLVIDLTENKKESCEVQCA